MSSVAEDYYSRLFGIIRMARVTGVDGAELGLSEGVDKAVAIIRGKAATNKVMFIGNGGSAGIASHMATDFSKNGGIRAVAFNDSSLLTCIGNDFGYAHVFEKPIEFYADPGDVLVAISSSGKSENILRAVGAARNKGCEVITLSGFGADNPLSKSGDINFYVPTNEYGPVEVLHHSICHCIMDAILRTR